VSSPPLSSCEPGCVRYVRCTTPGPRRLVHRLRAGSTITVTVAHSIQERNLLRQEAEGSRSCARGLGSHILLSRLCAKTTYDLLRIQESTARNTEVTRYPATAIAKADKNTKAIAVTGPYIVPIIMGSAMIKSPLRALSMRL
jgi:hypothetical protein